MLGERREYARLTVHTSSSTDRSSQLSSSRRSASEPAQLLELGAAAASWDGDLQLDCRDTRDTSCGRGGSQGRSGAVIPLMPVLGLTSRLPPPLALELGAERREWTEPPRSTRSDTGAVFKQELIRASYG